MGPNDANGGSRRTGLVRNTRWWVWLLPGILACAVAAIVSVWIPPVPSVHDDFGHLLIAETFLQGRISNPTPPSAESLQTFHELVYPRYAAKFPIGTGAILALGHVVFGVYCAGIWLSAGFACSAITWMLLGHFKKNFALLFGMLSALHPYWQTGWSQNFTNGWLAVGAMSLIVGGLLRIRGRTVWGDKVDPSAWRPALVIAIGVVFGIFTRPYETVVVTSILGIPLLARIISAGWYRVPKWWLHAAPGLSVLAIGIVFQAYINHSVTGSWRKLPYQLHEEQYGVAPVFVWQKPHAPSLGHRYLEQTKFHDGWSMDAYRAGSDWQGYANLLWKRSMHAYHHWGWFFACTPLALVILPRERRVFAVYFLAGIGGLCLINFVPWVATYYVASLLPIAILLTALAARRAMQWFARRANLRVSHDRLGALVLGAMLACQAVWLCQATSALAQNPLLLDNAWAFQRRDVVRELDSIPGEHLVMVRYHPDHTPLHEWVYNSHDPSLSKIVWARWSQDLYPEIIRDYPNRKIWILDVRSINSDQDSRETNVPVGKDHFMLCPWTEPPSDCEFRP
jgi:hypothetical protein